MRIRIQNVSGLVLYVLLVVSAVVVVLFFGGEDTPQTVADGSVLEAPARTDLLLCWVYFLLGVCVAVAVGSIAWHFSSLLTGTPKVAVKSLAGIVSLGLLMGVAWWAGSSEPLSIPGYNGTDNTPFWLRMADMFLYTIYVLMALLVLLMLGNRLRKR